MTKWIADGGKPERCTLIAPWQYRWSGYWFDKNWLLQEKLYPAGRFEDDGGRNLLFVLSFWRTGTTLLHELLALGPKMAAPRTWQCMNPSAFRLSRPPRMDGPTERRPMDAVLVNAFSPQEDEFMLLARGTPSVYRAWIDPRRYAETLPALSQDTWLSLADNEWLVDWHKFLGWCMPDGAVTLVVKSPNHTFRLQAIDRVWPKARFVWTCRDPADTWFSNRKMWHAMMSLYALWNWRLEDIDRLLYHAFENYAATLRWALEQFEPSRVIFMEFEHLAPRPGAALQKVVHEYGLGRWEDWQPLVQPQLDQSAKHPREDHPTSPRLPKYAEELLNDVRDLHRLALSR